MESEESLMLLFGLQNVKFSVKLEAPETDGGVHTNVSVSSFTVCSLDLFSCYEP